MHWLCMYGMHWRLVTLSHDRIAVKEILLCSWRNSHLDERLSGLHRALMMHYSNWLIDVKNRASLRNACKTPPYTDWNNRGIIAGLPNEKTALTAHLWRTGKENGENADLCTKNALNIRAPRWKTLLSIPPNAIGHRLFSCRIFLSSFREKAPSRESESVSSSSGQGGGRRRAPLPRRRSANRASGARLTPARPAFPPHIDTRPGEITSNMLQKSALTPND